MGFLVFSATSGRIARLDGASLLVLWGLFIVVAEHAGFGISGFRRSQLTTHEGFHLQMLAAYGLAALLIAAVVIAPLVRRGNRYGWFGLLALLVVGFGAEVATAVITTPHGVAPRWWSWGLALWAYPIAWAAALGLSWRGTFRRDAAEART